MKRILVVDDELTILDVLREILEGEGYSVQLARDGVEGLRKIEAEPPDLVLLDLMMPILDGRAVLERLEQQPQTQRLPVVLMSAGRVGERVLERARDFLAKPFELDALLNTVETQIGAP